MRTQGKKIIALAVAAALLTALLPGAAAWTRQDEYQEGLALATDGTRWGYADGAGSLTIPLRFSQAEPFYLGVAKVTENGKQGLLRQSGSYLLQPVYDSLESVGYGLYIGRQGGKWKLLSVTELPSAGGETGPEDPHQLYPDADLIAWERSEDGEALVLRWNESGEEVRLTRTELPQLLKERGAPGWAFPLETERRASFSDVGGRDWFSPWVDIAYSVNLMEGRGDGQFQPYESLRICEALKLVALMDSQGTGRVAPTEEEGQHWYDDYLRYCTEQGILLDGELSDYERPITRAELALLISRTALFRSSPDLNDLSRIRVSVPDVKTGDYAASAIFGLYAKGILTGSDSAMTFHPRANITRAEVAAIVARMVRPEQRVTLRLGNAGLRSAPIKAETEEKKLTPYPGRTPIPLRKGL